MKKKKSPSSLYKNKIKDHPKVRSLHHGLKLPSLVPRLSVTNVVDNSGCFSGLVNSISSSSIELLTTIVLRIPLLGVLGSRAWLGQLFVLSSVDENSFGASRRIRGRIIGKQAFRMATEVSTIVQRIDASIPNEKSFISICNIAARRTQLMAVTLDIANQYQLWT